MILQSPKLIQSPLVSVVVITYNQEHYIRQCIDSILAQKTDFEYEIIIGEDCGTDFTRDICIEYQNKYPEKIKLLLQEMNQGLIKNYRDVLNLCRGKYIAQCAGDDYWCESKKLQLQYNCLETKSGYGFVRTGGYMLEKHKLIDVSSTAHDNSEGNVFDVAKYGPVSLAASIFFKKSLLRYIDFNEFIRRDFSLEDYPLNAIMAKHTNFAYIPERCVVYRRVKNSISQTKQAERFLHYVKGYVSVRRYLNELYPNECNFDLTELADMEKYAEIKVFYRQYRFEDAKNTAKQIHTTNYMNKKLVRFTANYFTFYLLSIFMAIKSMVNSN